MEVKGANGRHTYRTVTEDEKNTLKEYERNY